MKNLVTNNKTKQLFNRLIETYRDEYERPPFSYFQSPDYHAFCGYEEFKDMSVDELILEVERYEESTLNLISEANDIEIEALKEMAAHGSRIDCYTHILGIGNDRRRDFYLMYDILI